VQTTWQVTAPAGTAPGAYSLSAAATLSGTGPYTDSSSINVAYPSIAAAYDNTGISDDSNPSAGNFDGGGASYSAQALAAAGLSPGGAFNHDGATITWPNVVSGQPDNIVASGQTVPLSGSGNTLAVLGSSAYGASSGTGTIVYTDGSTQSFSLAFADWWSASAVSGTDIAATMSYINTGGGKSTQTVHMYYAAVPIQSGKMVQAVVLPNVSANAAQGVTAMHIFAMAVAGASSSSSVISLRAHANNDIVTADNAGASPLIANRTAIGPWEEFDQIHD